VSVNTDISSTKNNPGAPVPGIPLRVESSVPVRLESSAPVRLESSAPVRLESSAPVRLESSGPVRLESSGPVRLESSVPVRLESANPVRAQSEIQARLEPEEELRPTPLPTNRISQLPINAALTSIITIYDTPAVEVRQNLYLTLLVYCKKGTWTAMDKKYKIVKNAIVSDDIIDLLSEKATVVDAVVYTTTEKANLNPSVAKILGNAAFPIDDVFVDEYKQEMTKMLEKQESLSKCDEYGVLKSPLSFVSAAPSPDEKNNCLDIPQNVCEIIDEGPSCSLRLPVNFPFNFARSTLHSQSRKLIMNLLESLKYLRLDNDKLKGTPLQQVGQLLNFNYNTVSKVTHAIQSGAPIVTPGKKRKFKTYKRIRLMTKENVDILKETIKDFYRQHQAPTANQIFRSFLENIRKNLLRKAEELPVDPDFTVEDIPESSCHFLTFRKMLKSAGFKFGKVNNRAFIVQQPDKIEMRGQSC
jgi:hypothetical protein